MVRYAEIHLKGLNRPFFERQLADAIRHALRDMQVRVERTQGRMYVWGLKENEMENAITRLRHVFGIHSVSPALAVDKEWETVCEAAAALVAAELKDVENATFKVRARRQDKSYFLSSDEINRKLGGVLLERFPNLRVDVHEPKIRVGVEIRQQAFIYVREVFGTGGMPVGSNGKAALLISGGIDSPVAGYMILKRGVELCAVHFFSYPYTSERARDKVVELTRQLAVYGNRIELYLVPFTEIQLAIYEQCPSSETTVLMRRQMMRIAEMIAKKAGAQVLVTGEAIGQVASQTIESLTVTNDAVTMPVFRPLIGFDKEEITDKAKQIGTFETSILPYEDCCTVFVPRHPVTKPKLEKLRQSEARVDFTQMIEKALRDMEVLSVTGDFTQGL